MDVGDCYNNSSANPAGESRLQMYNFIASLKSHGKTSYKKGLCKAVEMLNNQDSHTRHHRELTDTKSIV